MELKKTLCNKDWSTVNFYLKACAISKYVTFFKISPKV